MTLSAAYKQDVTYWGSPQPSGYGGNVFTAPVTFKARWEGRAEQVFTPTGDEIVSQAVVFVPQDLDIGGYLYLGTSVAADPTAVAGAFEVKQFLKVPDLHNMRSERRAIL